MSSKPKSKDYKPSAADQANASVAMAEYRKFKQLYDPLLQDMRDKSLTKQRTAAATLRGRAGADTMQALSAPSLTQARRVDRAGDVSQALLGQYGIANRSALDVANTMKTGVLGTARGQAADAQTGMAQASRLGTSAALSRAKAKQDVAQAKFNTAVQLGSALVQKGAQNRRETGNIFQSGADPVINKETGGLMYRQAKGFFNTEDNKLFDPSKQYIVGGGS